MGGGRARVLLVPISRTTGIRGRDERQPTDQGLAFGTDRPLDSACFGDLGLSSRPSRHQDDLAVVPPDIDDGYHRYVVGGETALDGRTDISCEGTTSHVSTTTVGPCPLRHWSWLERPPGEGGS
jgi:hypothetical protein